MMHFKLGVFNGKSLMHLHRKHEKQCEITCLGTHLACQTCPWATQCYICTQTTFTSGAQVNSLTVIDQAREHL